MIATTVIDNDGKAPPAIVFLPAGEHELQCSVNGEPKKVSVLVEESCLESLNKDLEAMLAKNVKPSGMYDHKEGVACYRPAGPFSWDERGVILPVEWTSQGRADIEGGNYAYHSAHFRRNKDTGKVTGLCVDDVELGSLTNNPAFDLASEKISASRSRFDDNDKDKNIDNNNNNKGNGADNNNNKTMNLDKLVAAGILTAEEAKLENALDLVVSRFKAQSDDKGKIEQELDTAKCQAKEANEKLEASKQEIAKAQEQIEASKKQAESLADAKIDEAIKAGKLAPQDETAKAFWKSNLLNDHVSASKQLESLGVNPAFKAIDKKSDDEVKTSKSLSDSLSSELEQFIK